LLNDCRVSFRYDFVFSGFAARDLRFYQLLIWLADTFRKISRAAVSGQNYSATHLKHLRTRVEITNCSLLEPMDADRRRKSDIEYWWENADSFVELLPLQYNQLRKTFFDILEKLPEEDFEKFLQESPNIICNANIGRVVSYAVPVPPKVPRDRLLWLNGIYLEPRITKRKNLVHLIAHEIAHIVREDHRNYDRDAERKSDDLSESWGFKRCYSKRMLERSQ
jgi:hypothetical protein